MPERNCGDCTACCHALAIEELDKPGFQKCAYVQSGNGCAGCGIYDARPDCCRDFQCLWLQGHLAEDDRPDKLGVIFTTTGHPDLGTIPLLIEVDDGAMQRPTIKDAVQRFLTAGPVAVSTPAGGKLIRPTSVTVKGKPIDDAA